jgi:uncharacterized damage-inducible protein DinB
MLSKDALARLLEYTVWANHRALRAAATLSDDDFKRDLKSSHGGVRGTLTHTLSAEWIWLERWKGISPTRGIDEGEFPTLLALRDRWTALDEHRASWLASLSEDAPFAVVAYKTLDGRPYEAPLWELVQHVANHSTYHRGQVITMLRQLGAKPVSTDMVIWDREATARHRE